MKHGGTQLSHKQLLFFFFFSFSLVAGCKGGMKGGFGVSGCMTEQDVVLEN